MLVNPMETGVTSYDCLKSDRDPGLSDAEEMPSLNHTSASLNMHNPSSAFKVNFVKCSCHNYKYNPACNSLNGVAD